MIRAFNQVSLMVKTKIKTRKKMYQRYSPTLIAGIVLLSVIITAIVIMRSAPQSATCNGVTVYLGTSAYGGIDRESIDKVLTDLVSYLGIDIGNGTWVIMFGSTGCPHCKAMDNFFKQNYPDIYRALWVDKDQKASSIFYTLVEAEKRCGITSIAGVVPQTIVVKNGSVHTVIVGEILDRNFWGEILR